MSDLVIKNHALIEAGHKLSEIEQRLILLAIFKARECLLTMEQLKDQELVIYASDYSHFFGLDRDSGYKNLKKAVLKLFEAKWAYRFINQNGNVEIVYERFIQSAKYIKNEGMIKFMFSNQVIPMLIKLERHFTNHDISQISRLQSRYAMRLYECLIDLKNHSYINIDLNDLRFRFGLLESEYQAMGDFKRFVLDLAVKQINQFTDLKIIYEQYKQGRVIKGFKFSTEKKKEKEIKENKNKQSKIVKKIKYQNNTKKHTFISMTNEQRFSIAKKIARLHEASYLARGEAGLSYEAFTLQIAQDLLDVNKQKLYLPFLEKK